jgi:PAS domain S-box-containing protein
VTQDAPTPVNILLVDDRPENLTALKAILDTPEYRLVAVTSGKEALKAVLRENFAVILLDVVMPEMDGFEVAQHLKELNSTRYIPVLFLTAIATDMRRIYRAYEAGAVDYLIKPLDNDVVRRKVAVFVDLFRHREKIERQAELLRANEKREFELRLAELRMATDRRYRALIEGIDNAVSWTINRDRRLTFVSGQAPRVLGYPMEEFLEPEFWERRIHPDDRAAFIALTKRAQTGADNTDLRLNHRMMAADGRIRWFHTGVTGTREEGEVHGISVDVTDIKNAEMIPSLLADVAGVLSESLDYRDTLPTVAKVILPALGDWCLIDEVHEGRRVRALAESHVEPLWEGPHVHGLPRREELDLEAPSGIGHVVATRRAELHRQVSDTRWLADALGSPRIEELQTSSVASCMFIPLLAHDRVIGVMTLVARPPRCFVPADLAVAQEVGRRIAAAIENALLYEAARRATRAREYLIAVVSHDLRSPLSAVIAAAAQIERTSVGIENGERLQKSARIILRSGERMDRLIGDLKDFSQLEFGSLNIERKPVDATEVIDESLEALRPLALEKGLVLNVKESEGLVVQCDRQRMLQILSNLVGNAIKFTPKGGSVSVSAERDEQDARFSVSDTGPGIEEAELPQIWERFWRSKRATEEGMGLGLAIAKGLVEAQGGRIGVESKLNVGTTFYFTLPLAAGDVARPSYRLYSPSRRRPTA